ncbi:hypothetical protein PG985_010456 [Apiospora marii]|uniref:Histone-lysine N-methyltransferase SET5 n=1 Tax=Apiospora marii TaxID=335849 RepID=A0ABR1RZB4_9PEZI
MANYSNNNISLDPEFYEVKPTWDHKGNGVFAKRLIRAGTILVQEKPIMQYPEHPAGFFQDDQLDHLKGEFDRLTEQQKQEMLTFHAQARADEDIEHVYRYFRDFNRPAADDPFAAQVEINAAGEGNDDVEIPLTEDEVAGYMPEAEARRYARAVLVLWSNEIGYLDAAGEEQRGLYLRASRLNHRCAPNILTNIATDGTITLRARQRILPGDELTMSYIELGLTREERRQRLLEDFGFECKCDLCDEEDLGPRAGMHEYHVAQLQMSDVGETLRMYRDAEFPLMPLSDANQYLSRCQKRFLHYNKLFWNDYCFYELANIADLWARIWQLTPGNTGPNRSPQAMFVADSWRKTLKQAVERYGPIVFDASDTHLVDARRTLQTSNGQPAIITPAVPAPADPVERAKSRTPEGRQMRRDRTRSPEVQQQQLQQLQQQLQGAAGPSA